jgi:hypothetical protein
MSYSIGTPANHLEEIKLFLEKEVKINQILIGLDHTGLIEQNEVSEIDLLRKRYPIDFFEKIRFYKSYLLYMPSWDYVKTVLSESLNNWSLLDKNGYMPSAHNTYLTAPAQHIISPKFSEKYVYLELDPDINKNISIIKEIKDLAEKKGIKLTFFLNPVFHTAFTTTHLPAYMGALQQLAKVTPFYDFSGIHEETLNKCNYHESSHYTAELADSIANIIFDKNRLGDFDFGTYVDTSNIQEHISNHFTALNRYYAAKNLYSTSENNPTSKSITNEPISLVRRDKTKGEFIEGNDKLLISSPLFAFIVKIPVSDNIDTYKIISADQTIIPMVNIDTLLSSEESGTYIFWIATRYLSEGIQTVTLVNTHSSIPTLEDNIVVHVAGVEGISDYKKNCKHAEQAAIGNLDQFHVVMFDSVMSQDIKGLVNLEGWLAHSLKRKPADEILVKYHQCLYPIHFRTYRSDVNEYLKAPSEELYGFYTTVPFFYNKIKKSDFQFWILDKESGLCEILTIKQ